MEDVGQGDSHATIRSTQDERTGMSCQPSSVDGSAMASKDEVIYSCTAFLTASKRVKAVGERRTSTAMVDRIKAISGQK